MKVSYYFDKEYSLNFTTNDSKIQAIKDYVQNQMPQVCSLIGILIILAIQWYKNQDSQVAKYITILLTIAVEAVWIVVNEDWKNSIAQAVYIGSLIHLFWKMVSYSFLNKQLRIETKL